MLFKVSLGEISFFEVLYRDITSQYGFLSNKYRSGISLCNVIPFLRDPSTDVNLILRIQPRRSTTRDLVRYRVLSNGIIIFAQIAPESTGISNFTPIDIILICLTF